MQKRDVYCPFCRAANPHSAYVCIRCFKVINENYKPSFWKMQISSFSGTIIIFATAFTAIVFFLSQWLDSVEGEIDVKVRTNEYNVSVAAEKTKKDFNVDITTGPPSATK
jgi:hypothetical protein